MEIQLLFLFVASIAIIEGFAIALRAQAVGPFFFPSCMMDPNGGLQ